jgi:glycosyltransferase involved in cell wall biosynthesis
MKQAVRRLLSARQFDIVHLDGTHMAAYADIITKLQPHARLVFNWHNIESEGMRRFAELSSSLPKRLYATLTARKLAAAEHELLAAGYGNIVCSERERLQLQQLVPGSRVAVVENGVDIDYVASAPRPDASDRILFVGLMAYHANVDGITWFANDIWSQVRRILPGKQLTIVGANPTPAVLALGSQPGIEVTGTVPDVRPYYAGAFAAIAPLRTGAGTRLKILEAMAARVPVISTPLGAEGLECSPGRDILIARDAGEWVQAFTELTDESRRQQLTAAASDTVSGRYDWKIIRGSLCDTYAALFDR